MITSTKWFKRDDGLRAFILDIEEYNSIIFCIQGIQRYFNLPTNAKTIRFCLYNRPGKMRIPIEISEAKESYIDSYGIDIYKNCYDVRLPTRRLIHFDYPFKPRLQHQKTYYIELEYK